MSMEVTPYKRLAPWRAAGQAVAGLAGQCGRWTHRLAQLALALTLLAIVAVAALSVRLSQGPLPLDWLARRLTAMANADDAATRLSVGSAAIAWQGLHAGLDSPLELVLGDITLADRHGQSLHLPRAAITLAMRPLLQGRLAVRAAELDGLRLHVLRAADGATRLDIGSLAEGDAADSPGPPLTALLTALAAPPSEASGPADMVAALRRLRIRNSVISVDDRQFGLDWSADIADVTLDRARGGGASGRVQLDLHSGTATAPIHLDARTALLRGGGITLAGGLSAVVPATLAGLSPRLAPLAAIDAPLTLSGTLTLDAALGLGGATLDATLGTGALHLGTGTMPIQDAAIRAAAGPDGLHLTLDHLHLQAAASSPVSTLRAQIDGRIDAGQIDASATVDLDQAAFADLPTLWPAGIGGPGTRPWVIENLTGGIARNAHVNLALHAPTDFSDAVLTHIDGGFEASDVTCWWLRPAPPIEHGAARLVFIDPDTIDVDVTAGSERGTGLTIQSGRIHLTGIAGHDQFMAIDSKLAGPFADVVRLLHHPAIRILDKLDVPIEHPAGQVETGLTVSMPLKTDLSFDNVAIHAHGHLAEGHLGGTAAGRDLDQAQLDVDVGNTGLQVKGTASIAGVATGLAVAMDFRGGPPTEVLQKVDASATLTPADLARLGLATQGAFTGSAAATLNLTTQRNGLGRLALHADLRRAGLDGGPLDWHKSPGSPGQAALQLRLTHERITAIDRLHVEAPELEIDADAEMAGGRPSLLRVQKLVVGPGTSLSGDVRLPPREGDPILVRLSGPRLDLSRALDRRGAADAPSQPEQRGRPFDIDARIDRVATGHGQSLTEVVASVENDGLITRTANLRARAGAGAFTLALAPQPGGRHLTGTATDAGALLRAFDVIPDMEGGTLQLDARYDDTKPQRPLSGRAEISGFRLRQVPAIARLLQAMSLYGLVELVQGPGLGFDQLVAPFTLQNQVLTLNDARAYSASLGMTAKGRIDLRHKTADIDGTIVPAYFFNTLPGRLPLIGKLFSPETGGGLFAASYAIRGPADDPSVSVNPLSALTPGFLRGLFSMFGTAKPGQPAPPREQGSRGGR
jgi:hypothetical protein